MTMVKEEEEVASRYSLVHVSVSYVILCASPLVLLAAVSYWMRLRLESPILVGCVRTFVQLSVLGFILRPIFVWGAEYLWVVLIYAALMILVTSYECASRPLFYFRGMFPKVLWALGSNVVLVSLFAFGLVVRPQPVPWEPQYVIPIIGMLLGNAINGVSLALSSMLKFLVEGKAEIELMLSFGATSWEASTRLVREAVRTGAMPILNSMAMIGLIYIPGMMTGQILGGSPVIEAARYQMVIMYLIAICAFGTIFTEVFLVLQVAFEADTLRTDRFFKRAEKSSFLDSLISAGKFLGSFIWRRFANDDNNDDDNSTNTAQETQTLYTDVETYAATGSGSIPKGQLRIESLLASSIETTDPHLQVIQARRSFQKKISNEERGKPFILFQGISFQVRAGEIVLVGGPSGTGKSQLLRVIASLVPMEWPGDACLDGKYFRQDYMKNITQWRQQVRYVTQSKIDIPGTPKEFMSNLVQLGSWKQNKSEVPSEEDLSRTSLQLLKDWDMETNSVEKEWSQLSGGEGQRVITAIALASRPRVLLMDEATSALDDKTKIKVEQSVIHHCKHFGMSVVWVSHDMEQLERIRRASS